MRSSRQPGPRRASAVYRRRDETTSITADSFRPPNRRIRVEQPVDDAHRDTVVRRSVFGPPRLQRWPSPLCGQSPRFGVQHHVGPNAWRGMWLALALGGGCSEPARAPAEPPITRSTPPCRIEAPLACRVGCDADVPRKIADAAPDLSGLDVAGLRGLVIVEILVDERGDVKSVCLLRGVRQDVDLRAMAAIRRWRFEPARLRHSTPPAEPVPVVITVALPIGRSAPGPPPAYSNAIARGPGFHPCPTRSGTSSNHDPPLRHTSCPSTDTEATHCASSRIV